MKLMSKLSGWSSSHLALSLAVGLIALSGASLHAQNQTVSGHLHVTGDTSLSGALNVTGVAELNNNVTNFGANGANATTPGLVLTYTDTVSGTVSTITLATSGTTAIWQWERNSANGLIPQMTLTGTNSIILWNPTISNSAGIVLNPAGDSTFSGSITATGTNSRLPNQQISTDTASVLTKGYADGAYLTPTGNGSALTGLNASNITTGMLGDARLTSNVGLLNGNQTYTGNHTYTGTQTFNGVLNSKTVSASSVAVSGSLSAATISATSAIGLPKNTQYGLAANYDASQGDVYGIEQVTNGQAGSLRAATRIFTSGYAPAIPEIAFGKYTGTNSFTTFGVFTYTGSFIVGTSSDGLGNGQAGDIIATGSVKLMTAGSGLQIQEGGSSHLWALRGSTNSTQLALDYNNGAQVPISINTNSVTISGNLTATTVSGDLVFTGTNGSMPNQQITSTVSILTKGLADGLYMPASTTNSPYLTTTVAASTYLTSAQAASSYIPAGYQTTSTGSYSTALGYNTVAAGNGQLVVGQYNSPLASQGDNSANWISTDALFVIGNGTSDLRSNALVVSKNGDALIAGSATVGKRLNVAGNATFQGSVKIPQQGDLSMGSFTNSGLTRAQTVAETYFNALATPPAAANISDPEKENIISFLTGLDQIVGLDNVAECWTLRSTQNTGTGITVYGLLGKYNGTLLNGATWTTQGMRSSVLGQSMSTSLIKNNYSARSYFAVCNIESGDRLRIMFSGIGEGVFIHYNASCNGLWMNLNWATFANGDPNHDWQYLRLDYAYTCNQWNSHGLVYGGSKLVAYGGGEKIIETSSTEDWAESTSDGSPLYLFDRADYGAVGSIGIISFALDCNIALTAAQQLQLHQLYKSTIGQGLGLP